MPNYPAKPVTGGKRGKTMRVQSEMEIKRGIKPPKQQEKQQRAAAIKSSYLYRLYTEDINRELIAAEVSQYYQGFTLIPSSGYWAGAPESSLIIEISVPHEDGSRINRLAGIIRRLNNQQAVLVQSQLIRAHLV